MEDTLGPDYDDSHRTFLQVLLAHSTLTFEEAQPILAAIFTATGNHESEVRPDQITQEIFEAYIEVASEAASMFDYEVRSIIHQVTKQRLYALVNTHSDPQTQLATVYSPEELAFIKRVLDTMFDKFNTPRMEVLAVTEMQAFKLARPRHQRPSQIAGGEPTDPETPSTTPIDRGLKHSEVHSALRSLVDGGWFTKSRDGFYTLTPRSLMELRPWLVETYNDVAEADEWQRIKFCAACKEIVTIGLRCSEPDCVLRLHDMCQDAFWRAERSKNCPKCRTEWKGDRHVGERAVTMTESYRKGKMKRSGRRSTLADDVIREAAEEDAEDDAEEEELDDDDDDDDDDES
ncbi:hypothetical protein QQS21_010685 [Conoideocrella luteorostrata]|uniref:Non-structural maintenance of chromosomes element 1 homolog n=1 Tax=Conoideocrella luteorostrata TaxID=1105319 RepID=A0AAJ0CEP8_9HYPO|nr:hypothetical protein QQS21_010685 [Conoideocrella luteorostrata]